MKTTTFKTIILAVAAGLIVSSCKKNLPSEQVLADTDQGKLKVSTISPALPGGPGTGKMFFGATSEGDPTHMSPTIQDYEQALFGTASGDKMFSLLRMYNSSAPGHAVSPQFLLSSSYRLKAEAARDEGRIPILNFGISSYPIETIATGLYDSTSAVYTDMMSNINWFKTAFTGTHYAWVTFCHEPNDDFNDDTQGAIAYPSSPSNYSPAMRQAYYRHAFRKIYLMMKAKGVTNVLLWSPAFGYSTFTGAPTTSTFNADGSVNDPGITDFHNVHPHYIGTTVDPNGNVIEDQTIPRRGTTRWAASSVRFIDGEAIDCYNPYSGPVATAENKTWDSIWTKWTNVLTNGTPSLTNGPQTQDFPRAIFELGTYTFTASTNITVLDFHKQLVNNGPNNGLVGVSEWNRGSATVTVTDASSATPNDKVKGVKFVANNLTHCNMVTRP